jgi:hypothetical protein
MYVEQRLTECPVDSNVDAKYTGLLLIGHLLTIHKATPTGRSPSNSCDRGVC